MLGGRRADSMAQRAFTFVICTENPVLKRHQDDDLSTIRSHAMREVRRFRTLASGESTYPTIRPRRIRTSKDSNRYQHLVHATLSREISRSRTFSNSYCGTAIELSSLPTDVPQRLQYFVHGFTPLTFPTTHVHHECDMLRIATNEGSPALLHALCAVSTAHRDLVRGPTTLDGSSIALEDKGMMRSAFLSHKQLAVILLQANLSKAGDFQIESSLATVTLLLMKETLSGDTATADAHRSGLLELKKRYGKARKLPHLMVSDVLMSDLKSATSSLSKPSIRPCDEWLSEFDILKHLPFFPYRPDFTSLGSGFLTTKVSHFLGPSLVLLMCAMRILINALERNFDVGNSVSEVNGAHFLVLEYQLLSFQSGTDGNGLFGRKLAECCRIGALLYCNLCLWTWPKNARLVENLLFHLRTAISEWTPELYAYEQFSVLLWFYFIGSFATSSTEESQWYLKGMKDVSKWLDIQDEDHFRSILASLFYVDRLMGQHLKDCYIKISRRSSRDG